MDAATSTASDIPLDHESVKRQCSPEDDASEAESHQLAVKDVLHAWDACSGASTVEGRIANVLDLLLTANARDDESLKADKNSLLKISGQAQKLPYEPVLDDGHKPPDNQSAYPGRAFTPLTDSSEDNEPVMVTRSPIGASKDVKGKGRPRGSSSGHSPSPKRVRITSPKSTSKARQKAKAVIFIDSGSEDDSIEEVICEKRSSKTDISLGHRPTSSSASNSLFSIHEAPSIIREEAEPVDMLAQVLSIVPDVHPDHAANLISEFFQRPNCVDYVIESLFGRPYLKADPASKTGSILPSTAASSSRMNPEAQAERYLNVAARSQKLPPSPEYAMASFDHLCIDFPRIPLPYIRKVQLTYNHFYAPTFRQLEQDALADPCPFVPLISIRKDKGKKPIPHVSELEEERSWIQECNKLKRAEQEAQAAAELRERQEEEAGHTFECGCCYCDVVFSKGVQCPEAHLFCMDCARRNAEEVMGNRKTELCCMDSDGCTAQFSLEECRRFLKPVQLVLLDQLRSEKAMDSAGLAGLSKCPHCPWACIIENPDERLLRCENEECLRVTCRKCQKSDHLPKTCEEYAADLKTNTIHKVEEAMTEALIRKCPQCKQAFLKEYGCNNMTCPNCGTHSCFVCGEKIEGYHHFRGQSMPVPPLNGVLQTNTTSKCQLWDDAATRQYHEVEAARMRAVGEIKGNQDVQVDDTDLFKLNLEKPKPQNPRAGPARMPPPYPGYNAFNHAYVAAGPRAVRGRAQPRAAARRPPAVPAERGVGGRRRRR